jgi:hypothetical protein
MERVIMKSVIAILLFSIIAIKAIKVHAQCLKDSVFVTDSIGTYTDKMPLRMVVYIKNDSIIIAPVMMFKILSKLKCEWNNTFTEGITSYKALPAGSNGTPTFPTINIVYKNNGQKYIEILYDKGEARVLSIEKVKRD